MPNTLFIRPTALSHVITPDEKHYEWALFDVAGALLKYGAKSTLDIIDQTLMQNGLDQVDLIGLLPACAVLSTQVSVPGNQTRYIQQALPFAVEDQIAQDIDDMHLVLGSKYKSGSYRVLCTGHAQLSEFFAELNQEERVAGLKAIYVDSDLLDLETASLKILLSANQAFILDAQGQANSIQADNLIPYLDTLFLAPSEEEGDEPVNVELVLDKDASEQSKLLIAEIEQYPHIQLAVKESSLNSFEYLCAEYFNLKKLPLNLCQGTYQISSRNQSVWSRWRAVAMIAGFGFLLQLGIFVAEGSYLSKQAEQVSQQALAHYKQAIPTARNISVEKLPRIIKGQLNQLNAGGVEKLDFLDLLGEAGQQFNSNQYKTSLVFHSINFSSQRGELMLELHAKSFDQLESLKKAIVDAGLTAKISSAVQEKDYFKGRISVSGV